MVFSVSENVNKGAKDGSINHDAEANWEELSTKCLIPSSLDVNESRHEHNKTKQRSRSKTFCIIVPWMLFCLCLFLLSCTSTWGWRQHFLAQDLLAKIAAEKTNYIDNVPAHTPVPEQSVVSPSASKDPHPYGNDGLAPKQPSQIEEDNINEEIVDITVIEEHVVEKDIIEQPQAIPEDPLASDAELFAPPKTFLPPLMPVGGPSGVPCNANSAAAEGVKDAEQPSQIKDDINEKVDTTVIEEHGVDEDSIGEENPEQPQAIPEDPLASDAGLFAPLELFLPLLVPLDGPSGFPCDNGVQTANSAVPVGVKDAEQPSQIEEVVINEEVDTTVMEEHVFKEDIVGEKNPEQPQAIPKDPLASKAGLVVLPGIFLPPLMPMDGLSGVPCKANSAAAEGVKEAKQPSQIEEVVTNEEVDTTVMEEHVVDEDSIGEENPEQPQVIPENPSASDAGIFALPRIFLPPLMPIDGPSGVPYEANSAAAYIPTSPRIFLPPLVPMDGLSGYPCDDGVETGNSNAPVGVNDAEPLHKSVDIIGVSRDDLPVG